MKENSEAKAQQKMKTCLWKNIMEELECSLFSISVKLHQQYVILELKRRLEL